ERLDEAGNVDRAVLPAELGKVPVEPQLEGLRRDGGDALDHVAPALVAFEDRSADGTHDADSHAEHHEVEVGADVKDPRACHSSVPLGFEVDVRRLELRAVLQLLEERSRRPARKPLDEDERTVLLATPGPRLDVELE